MSPAWFALFAWFSAADSAPVAKPAPPPGNVKLGISYVATSGNTETSTAGVNANFSREVGRFELEGNAAALRSSQKGRLKAERYQAGVRARRKRSARRLRWAVGLAAERNRFTGIDLRTVTDWSLAWTVREGPERRLETQLGLTATREEPLAGEARTSLGGLVGAQGGMKLSPNSDLGAELNWYPNLDDGADHRFAAKVTLGAALTRHLGLELGYDWRYDHRPVPGFGKSDATATTSMVLRLGK